MNTSDDLTELGPMEVPIRHRQWLAYDAVDRDGTSGYALPIALAHWHLNCLKPEDYKQLAAVYIDPTRDQIVGEYRASYDQEHVSLDIEVHRLVDVSKLNCEERALFLAWASSKSFSETALNVLKATGINVTPEGGSSYIVRNTDYELCMKIPK